MHITAFSQNQKMLDTLREVPLRNLKQEKELQKSQLSGNMQLSLPQMFSTKFPMLGWRFVFWVNFNFESEGTHSIFLDSKFHLYKTIKTQGQKKKKQFNANLCLD